MPGVIENHDRQSPVVNHRRGASNSFDEKFQSNQNMKGGSRNRYPNGYSPDQMSDVVDDSSPRYLLEHLATFSVGSEFGLVSPKDGLRRLLQMEKTNGIWTQKMQMKLDKNWVLILDYEDGDVVEKFPMNLISDPTAYTSDDPRELYNNILVFIVREDPKSKNPNQSEMHIFQCARVYAQDVVDEMKMYMSGKVRAKTTENIRHLPPPPHNPPPDPPINGNSSKVRDQVAMFSASASSTPPIHSSGPRGGSVLQQRIERAAAGYARESNDETSSTTSDKYEREVTILNHCFDDIERFVVRLQHAAAAYKELERRQKNRKHKKKDMGDGMLSIRAKPPPEREFVDVLQKFKLSFNLLAKLKSHIHDPNAPELVHFLFTPLALIIDAARDSNHNANLAANVVSPLLTRDAIELLANCCTSKETDLWHSLGDSWIIPRDQWKGYESNYRPVFSNGWAPENPLEDGGSIAQRIQRPEPDLREQDYQRVFSHPERDSRYGSEYFGSERGDDNDRNESPGVVPDHHPHLRPGFDRPYEHMPSASRRDFIDRGNAMSPESDFHDPRDRDMRSEFSSDSIEHSELPLSPERQFDRQQMQWLEDLKSRRAKIVQVVYPRTANNEKELTVIRGEILEILDDSRKWWKARNMRGQIAHVPHTIVTPYPSLDDDIFNNPVYGSRSARESYYSTEGSPSKEHYVDEGTTRSQEASRSPSSGISRPAPADWVRRERQVIPIVDNSDEFELPLPSPPPVHSIPSSPTLRDSTPDFSPPPAYVDTSHEFKTFLPNNATEKTHHNNLERSDSNFSKDVKDKTIAPKPQIFSSQPKSPKEQIESSPVASTSNTPTLIGIKQPDRSFSLDSASNKDSALESFQEELKASLAQKKGIRVWKKITCPEHHVTDCYYINLNSTDAEVAHWMKLKGFSERAQEMLKDMSIEMLFKLQKTQLEKYLGDEGSKVHSYLLIQKNMCGYKTCTSKELSLILAERREKAEVF
ncbi:epidermal growth factor receptor kinase substrate 8-like isoform X1 [Stegodyphus dumicola]|uniref:epidermal growth factor receptor kinase substrate 8-like isoform X1 n=1 Tax=Stegodyphus dumicola TaxID=202533 RepID=UPI0015A7F53A|nr:epidermal growth factor receptor kinase substrate 8-like isoform X1 [Stegodyphus dumicola]XP_035220991.1 epidermal growth factor receptor kinase substrate 8-like isoform X1 [Stegodyphus dumicola]